MRWIQWGRTASAGPVVAITLAVCLPAQAAVRTWIGGNNDWNFSSSNWTGLDEPDPDDDAVFNTNNAVDMTVDNEVLSLDLSGDITLETRDHFLDVNGNVTLAGTGTLLRVGRSDLAGLPGTSLSAHSITVGADATFANANFTAFIDPSTIGVFEIESGGTLTGHDTIRNGDGISTPTVVFNNNGVIRPGSVVDFSISGNPTARTLTLTAIDSDARIDLDGNVAGGAVDLQRNQTLDIELPLNDAFDGIIDMAHNSTLDIESAWTFSGTLNVDNGFVAGSPPLVPDTPADVAFLEGGAITMNGASTEINVLDADGTLQIDTPFTANNGTITNNGLIVFNQDATISDNVNFQMVGVEADLTVGANATVEINDADMDFDGGGASTNIITVESGGLLDLNLDSFEGNDRADNFFTLNSGTLEMTVTDGSWTMDRRLTLNNNGGPDPSVRGSALAVGDDVGFSGLPDADIRVEGTGSSQINVPVTWNSDAEVDVDAGATLAVLGFSTFNTVNGAENALFDGPGNIRFNGGQVNEATTLNFSGGTVGLDGGGATAIILSAADFTVDAPLTINAAAFDSYGRSIVFPSPDSTVLTVNGILGGQLEVNLDNPSDTWEVNGSGVLNLIGSGAGASTVLDGSTLEMNGTMNVDGLNTSQARVVIGAAGSVSLIDAGAGLSISGGDLVTPNRIEGGTITGPGELSTVNNRALHGFGTIGVNLDFGGNGSELLADDGTLTLNANATLLDVGVLGTNDTDGTLNVTNAWNTDVTNEVRLLGGSLVGGTITNDAAFGINGFGTVTAQVINNTLVDADDGGTLLLINAGNDWDGTTNTGTLHARFGDLELVDTGSFSFSGTVETRTGQTVFANGFELDFASGSILVFTGGTYRSTDDTDLRGSVSVFSGTSTLDIDGTAVFHSSANVNLTGSLVLDNTFTLINAGATLASGGSGSLINPNGSLLSLADNADVNAPIDNHGDLAFAGAAIGNADGSDLQLNADGTLHIDLAGTSLTDFDRFTLTGSAELGGTLDVDLVGFDPAVGDQFLFLSAASVIGTFDTLDLPALDPGETWLLNYNATNLLLEVVAGLIGDYNADGFVSQPDLDLVLLNWGDTVAPTGFNEANLPGGGPFDGLISQNELDGVLLNWGNGTPPSVTAIPEPHSAALLVVLVGMLRRTRAC